MLKECIRVLLQVLDTLPMLLEGSEFSAGRAASFLKDRELGAQLVQRNEPFSLLVLIGAAFTIYFGKLIRLHLGLSVGVSTRHASLLFYQRRSVLQTKRVASCELLRTPRLRTSENTHSTHSAE